MKLLHKVKFTANRSHCEFPSMKFIVPQYNSHTVNFSRTPWSSRNRFAVSYRFPAIELCIFERLMTSEQQLARLQSLRRLSLIRRTFGEQSPNFAVRGVRRRSFSRVKFNHWIPVVILLIPVILATTPVTTPVIRPAVTVQTDCQTEHTAQLRSVQFGDI